MAAQSDIAAQGGENIHAETKVHLRYDGSDTALAVPLSNLEEMSAAFTTAHARQFGFGFEGRGLVVESIEVEASSAASNPPPFTGEDPERSEAEAPLRQLASLQQPPP